MQIIFELFSNALAETLIMISITMVIALLLGLPLGLFLVITGSGGIYEMPLTNRVLGSIVNVFRSIPFIILLVALLPFTRFLVGTGIGIWAAIVPLTVSAIPFFARISEVSFREVDRGLIEAAQAMGARRKDIIRHVLVPEALPGIVAAFTITTVTMISASAMAGAVGAGGLGDLAIQYGYQRFETDIMLGVIAVLVVLVTSVQFIGDYLARRVNRRL